MITIWNCSICGKPHSRKESVRNGVYIDNGDNTANYVEVCQKCVDKIADFINILKPKCVDVKRIKL